MKYYALIGEMAKRKVTIGSMAECLGLHRNAISYKLEKGSFDIEEAVLVRNAFFPSWEIEKLFEKSDK